MAEPRRVDQALAPERDNVMGFLKRLGAPVEEGTASQTFWGWRRFTAGA